ncbi:thioredoxin family protein [Sediminitomix flava]|uniref:Thioredoxin-related protein n=1 Tax=Sediminitomix flava TaxID=379075 RepID=A0A315Z7L8_SEDFL|nr:thioredoxin family protein [Sediminitomix flava]PWJ39200.1 thioredoxin-related protein [Sediminitomix flava]
MMKKILLVALFQFVCLLGMAQKHKIYDPSLDGQKQLTEAIALAKQDGKHVFVQVGGNWCSWCIKFHKFVGGNETLKQILEDNYVVVKLNYSNDNKNEKALAQLNYPQRFGYPSFVILDGNGNRLHTQDSGYLESGQGYDEAKVKRFFELWTPNALDPKHYQ